MMRLNGNLVMNGKTHRIYSDKLRLSVVDLTQIPLATEEDRFYEIDTWASLFKATMWEELKMTAKDNEYLKEAAETAYLLSAEEAIRQQRAAREDFYRQRNMRNKKLFWTLFFWVYLAALFKITVFRSGFGTHGLFENGSLNLSLFTGYLPLLKAGDWDRLIYLFIGNIIWFVPFGMYLKWKNRKQCFGRIAFLGFLLSLMIECLQYAFGTGYSELDDLILNTSGAWLGAAAVSACGRIRLLITEYRRQEG